MSQPTSAALTVEDLWWNFREHRLRWLIPTFVLGTLGVVYAAIHRPNWEVTQALTVREEADLGELRPGRFNDLESLRNVHEMIHELATNPSVLSAVLQEVGPPRSAAPTAGPWPSPEDIESAQRAVELSPPNGAEFGTTELFHLVVQDPDRERAIALINALYEQLDLRFRELRNQNARSVIAELERKAMLAQRRLEEATARVAKVESAVGSDLPELRALHESVGGESHLRLTLANLEQELRTARAAADSDRQLLDLLLAAQQDPSRLVATPNRLLEALPALRRLKDGLIDTQLNMAELQGTMSGEHPLVQAAQVARTEIRGHLHRELEVAIRGLQAEQRMADDRISSLSRQLAEVQERMNRLAAMRADYSNQVAEAERCAGNLNAAEQALTAALASQSATETTSLIARVDQPQSGARPQGPGRTVIAAAGLLGGWLTGLGIVFLTAVPAPSRVSDPTVDEREPAGRAPAGPGSEPVVREESEPALPRQPAVPEAQPAAAAATLATPSARPQPAAPARRRVRRSPATCPASPTGSLSLKDALARFAADQELVN